jgi:hypothetical protein
MPVLAGLELAPVQAIPEPPIGNAVALLRGNENGVRPPPNVGKTVSYDHKKVLVGGDDGAVHLELDDGVGAIQGRERRHDLVGLRYKHQHSSQ